MITYNIYYRFQLKEPHAHSHLFADETEQNFKIEIYN